MNGRWKPLAAALAYHVAPHSIRTALLALTAAGGSALLAALGGPRPGMPDPVVPVTGAVVVGALAHMAGAVGGEVRSGRAPLWSVAAGGRLPWLVPDLVLRLAVLVLATAATVTTAACALALVADPATGAALWRTIPFHALTAVCLAAVGYGCSALARRGDGLLAALYIFPVSTLAVGLTALSAPERPAALLLAFPLEALLSFAPGAHLPISSWPGLGPGAHLALFVVAWLAVGLAVGWLRSP